MAMVGGTWQYPIVLMRIAIASAHQNIIVNLRLQRSMAYLDVNAQIICSYTYFLDNCNFSGFFSSFLIDDVSLLL